MTSSAPSTPAMLVGREQELLTLRERLRAGARLITLVGPPGIGKTRLAAELFREHLGGVRDTDAGVTWVDLATATSVDELCARIATATGLRLSWHEHADLMDELGWSLEGRGETTLFLDEADACVASLRAIATRWLSLGTGLRFVVTSRERLGIAGESLLELSPLDADGDDRAVLESPAGRLLLERSGHPADAEGLPALIRALEGIPLAIELAAARLSLASPREMLARWAQQLDLLGEGRSPEGSLRAGLDGSFRALSEPERAALAACSVFPGSFTLSAAEAVVGEGALALLSGVRDKSLLARSPGDGRLRLYGPVRAFAMERRATLAPEAARRHAVHFARLASDTEADDDLDRRLATLTAELDDLRHAFAFAATSEDISPSARDALALGLAAVLATRGPPREALEVLDSVAPHLEAAPWHGFVRGLALEVSGRLDEAIASFDAALSSPDASVVARAWSAIARTELSRGNLDRAEGASREALAVAPAGSHARLVALREHGIVCQARGDLDGAVHAYEEAHAEAKALDATARAARLRADLGAVRLQQRRLDEAEEQLSLALEELEERDDPVARGLAEGNLAILYQERGDLDRADALFRSAVDKTRQAGHQLYTAHLLGYAGAVAHERGALTDAVARYEDAIATLRRLGDARQLAVMASLRGAAEASRGRLDAAEDSLSTAEAALERSPDPGVALAVRIHRLHLVWARAERDDATLASLLATADELSSDPALSRSDDARLALRLLRATLGLGALSFDDATGVLVLPDGSRVDFSQRAVLSRLLVALLERRRAAPGEALDAGALLAAGWPGESPRGESGANRIKVSLSNLRKLGLRDLLLRNESGYYLDPQVPIVDP